MEIKEWKREEDDYQGIDTEICFPEDPTQVPDICVYLLAGNDPICYARIPAVEFIKRRNGGRPYVVFEREAREFKSYPSNTIITHSYHCTLENYEYCLYNSQYRQTVRSNVTKY